MKETVNPDIEKMIEMNVAATEELANAMSHAVNPDVPLKGTRPNYILLMWDENNYATQTLALCTASQEEIFRIMYLFGRKLASLEPPEAGGSKLYEPEGGSDAS